MRWTFREHARPALLGFGEDLSASRNFYADEEHVVFALSAYVESTRIRR